MIVSRTQLLSVLCRCTEPCIALTAFCFEPSDLQFWCLHDGAHLSTLEHPRKPRCTSLVLVGSLKESFKERGGVRRKGARGEDGETGARRGRRCPRQ